MSKQEAGAPSYGVLRRLTAGGVGAGLGAAAAAALLAGMWAFGVSVTGDPSHAYCGIGAEAGLLFGLTYPPQFGGEEEGGAGPENSWLFGIGALLCGLSCVFVFWGWPSYRILPVCSAVATGQASSSVTRTTYQRGKVIDSQTGVNFTYTVGGVRYRGSGETTTVRYDPARPDVYYPDTGLEARHARILEAPWVFAAGVTVLLIGVLLAMRTRADWARMWGASVAVVLLGAAAASAVIVWDDGAISQRLSGKVGLARRDSADQQP